MHTPPPGSPPQMSSSSSTHAVDVDVSIWRAIAGHAVNVPAVNSYVYYFPQGHLEQWSPYTAVPNLNFNLTPPIPCQVISVRYLTDLTSDRVMARIHLQPLRQIGPPSSRDGNGDEHENDDGDIVSYVKVLTPSDATSWFTVPRDCADKILPQLNLEEDLPVQKLVLKDIRGQSWEFRHIYKGTQTRHSLSTGWSTFVRTKRLIAGDSVVFMKKNSTKELFVGTRRAEKMRGDGKEVVAAMESAGKRMAFEVEYYPNVDIPDFVVMAEEVNKAIQMQWTEGMPVRMAVERGETSRKTWTFGVVTAISASNSVWRILQVNWDKPEVEAKYNAKKVNPWQIDPILPSLTVNLNNSSSLISNSPFPDGIRGAMHTLNPSTSNSSNHCQLQPQHGAPDPQHSNATVSTILSIGSSYSDNVSLVSQRIGNLESGEGGAASSFQLFGKTIVVPRDGGGKDGDDGNGGGAGDRCDHNI